MQRPSARVKAADVSQPRLTTHSCSSKAICAAGPPQDSKPMRNQKRYGNEAMAIDRTKRAQTELHQ